MSLKPQSARPIPAETVRVAEAAFPKRNVHMRLRDQFGDLYADGTLSPGNHIVPEWGSHIYWLVKMFRSPLRSVSCMMARSSLVILSGSVDTEQ
jgi:hypothetical protein